MKLEKKYGAPVALVNCMELDAEDIWNILAMLLEEFPAKEADIVLPGWTSVLPPEHKLKKAIRESVTEAASYMVKLKDIRGAFSEKLTDGMKKAVGMCGSYPDEVKITSTGTDAGEGNAVVDVNLPEGLYFDVISEITGIPMKNQTELLGAIDALSAAKHELDKYKSAIDDVNERGYGIVVPDSESLTLDEPEIVRQSGGYGVKIKARASSIHMIKTNIETEINPIVGNGTAVGRNGGVPQKRNGRNSRRRLELQYVRQIAVRPCERRTQNKAREYAGRRENKVRRNPV